MTQRDAILPFDGPTYEARDSLRLGTQLKYVRLIMARREWYALKEIQAELARYRIKAETQSISARLRDLRKKKFGEHNIERRRREPSLWEYRMSSKEAMF